MPSDPLILAFDTSAAHCAAALLLGQTVLVARAEDMGRGQGERLVPLLHEVLAQAGHGWGDLGRIAVGVGPGNFTGIRISVATARGLGLALGIPVLGVSTFQAIRTHSPGARAAVSAPRDQVYLQATPHDTPQLLAASAAGAPLVFPPDPAQLCIAMAHAAAQMPADAPAPAPLYIRAADAAPARDLPPVILDDA